jgi:hypothetical protein
MLKISLIDSPRQRRLVVEGKLIAPRAAELIIVARSCRARIIRNPKRLFALVLVALGTIATVSCYHRQQMPRILAIAAPPVNSGEMSANKALCLFEQRAQQQLVTIAEYSDETVIYAEVPQRSEAAERRSLRHKPFPIATYVCGEVGSSRATSLCDSLRPTKTTCGGVCSPKPLFSRVTMTLLTEIPQLSVAGRYTHLR